MRHGARRVLDRQLALFARAPRRGQVKTRLARQLGEDEALRIYQALLHGTLQRLGAATFPVLLYGEGDGLEGIAEAYSLRLRRQAGDDLGERMANALCDMLCESRSAAIVGVDIPLLDVELVESAFEMLEEAELVLGPTEDGGYCLIAARAPMPELFRDVAWGSTKVLAQTIAIASALGARVRFTETLWDVDRVEDAWRLRRDQL